MTTDKPSNKRKRKRKNRRKKSSKCTPCSKFAIEKSPFKDKDDNCIKIEPGPSTVLIFDIERTTIKSSQILKNVLAMDVGVKLGSLMNKEMQTSMDLSHLCAEFEKLLKKHTRLHIYRKIANEQLLSTFPDVNGKQVYSCKEVFHSLYFVLSHVLPKSLLGSKHNFKIFMKSAHRIVHGNLHQCLSLSSMVHGLKVGHITWLQNGLPSHSLRLSILARLVKWLLLYVQHIIHKSWHVAVCSTKELVYCHKNLWSELVKGEVKALLSNHKIRIMAHNSKDLEKIVNLGRTNFLIKKQGLRPITIFRQPKDVDSVNLRRDSKILLQQWAYFSECMNNPFSPRIEQLLHQGLIKIKKCHPDLASRPKYYFVRADVKDAFGSINHHQMLSILQELSSVFLPKNYKMQAWDVKRGRRVLKLFESKEMPFPRFWETSKLRKLQIQDARPLLMHIRDHVHRLGTSLGNANYKICHGIPQGMHLSATLCEIYYNALDQKHLKSFLKTACDEVFLRYCDDYLFLTPNKARAEAFLEKISHGFPDFTVTFNSQKSISNVNSDDYNVPFCGFYIDIDLLSVHGNYDAYENQKISTSLNLRKTQKLGRILLSRMRVVVKLSPVMVDPRLNSKEDVAQNIYGAALFMAFRFCAYVKYMFPSKTMNQKYLVECVKRGEKSIKNRVNKAFANSSQDACLKRPEIKWLVLRAFYARMKKSGSWCWLVLRFIRVTCDKIFKTLTPNDSQVLLHVTKVPLPKPFSTIQ